MPLGLFLSSIKNGDIDAKYHPIRRELLLQKGFDFGEGYNYLYFTWVKFAKAIKWY